MPRGRSRSRSLAAARGPSLAGVLSSASMPAGYFFFGDPAVGLETWRTEGEWGGAGWYTAVNGDLAYRWYDPTTGVRFDGPPDSGAAEGQSPLFAFGQFDTSGATPVINLNGNGLTLAAGTMPTLTALTHTVGARVKLTGKAPYMTVFGTAQTSDGVRMCAMLGNEDGPWGTYGGADRPAATELSTGVWYTLLMRGGAYRLNGLADGTYAEASGTGSVTTIGFDKDFAGRELQGSLGRFVVYTSLVDAAAVEAALNA